MHFCYNLGTSLISINIRTVGFCVKNATIHQLKCPCLQIAHTYKISSIQVCVIYRPRRPFYIYLKEVWLYERDSEAPSACSGPVAHIGNTIYVVERINGLILESNVIANSLPQNTASMGEIVLLWFRHYNLFNCNIKIFHQNAFWGCILTNWCVERTRKLEIKFDVKFNISTNFRNLTPLAITHIYTEAFVQ